MRLVIVLAALALAAPLAPPAASSTAPGVLEGFAVAPLVPLAVPTAIEFGPDGDLYATTLGGDVVRVHLAWTAAGPVATGTSVLASGFSLPLGLAFDGTRVFVSDSHEGAESGRTDGRVTMLDGAARVVVLDGLPNGRHNTNNLRLGPDGLLYVTNGNPNDNGVDGGEADVLPVSGAILRADPDVLAASPAVFRWPAGVAPQDLHAHPANADFRAKVEVFASGFRNVYDVAFSPEGVAYTAMNGADAPSSQDALYRIAPGTDYRFPDCYNEGEPGAVGADVRVVPNPVLEADCTGAPPAAALLGWHVCATGLDVPPAGSPFGRAVYVGECAFFFPEPERGVTRHDTSHKVARVLLDAQGDAVEVQDFLVGTALVTDVRFGPDGALYVADAEGVLRVAPARPTVPVLAAGFSFAPPLLVVPAGTTVEWQGAALPHTVTTAATLDDARAGRANDRANADGDPDTFHRALPQGGVVRHAFAAPGTYAYYCELHRGLGMVGEVVVLPGLTR
ncbi:MAG TPA: plastocyanin/azurin family copper-binding protein [Candidatus Thermoplasmatota archaeon]|nr:plastocyanin/azurin family copper-binding protein [Candidatus Thermoplasmatota archaeon]